MTFEQSPLFWIIGRGGMLGSRLSLAIESFIPGAKVWNPPAPAFSWTDPARLAGELNACGEWFLAEVTKRQCPWGVVWAAGAGVIGTSDLILETETTAFQAVLAVVERHLAPLRAVDGLVFLSSSAGGVYGGCPDVFITEKSECRPVSSYGQNKLLQEQIFMRWAQRHPGVICQIGRISNLYGPGQNLGKQQGLISHVSRCILWQRPVRLYVSLDTIRDYLHVDDCARQIAFSLGAWLGTRSIHERIKIFAAEQPTSIAQIIGAFSHLGAHRHPRVICAPSSLTSQQPRRLQFRSEFSFQGWPVLKTPLQVGIASLHQHQTRMFCAGRLPPPADR